MGLLFTPMTAAQEAALRAEVASWRGRALLAESQGRLLTSEVEALRAKRAPLTDEQIKDGWDVCGQPVAFSVFMGIVRAVEKRHGIDAARAEASFSGAPAPVGIPAGEQTGPVAGAPTQQPARAEAKPVSQGGTI